jgi:hypothetical protein
MGKKGCVCDRVVVRGEGESNQELVHTRFTQSNLLESLTPGVVEILLLAVPNKVLCRSGYK